MIEFIISLGAFAIGVVVLIVMLIVGYLILGVICRFLYDSIDDAVPLTILLVLGLVGTVIVSNIVKMI